MAIANLHRMTPEERAIALGEEPKKEVKEEVKPEKKKKW